MMIFWLSLYIFMRTSIVKSQYPASPINPIITPYGSAQTDYSMIHFSNDEQVDQIEGVEAMPDQIVVLTSKMGPVETLKVAINLVEIETGIQLPAYNMSGFFLGSIRGRYTIVGLKPDTWYGLSFHSEQTVNGASYQHSDHQLIRTSKEKSLSEDEQEHLFSITVHTKDQEVDTRVITIKWIQAHENRRNFYVIVNLTLVCDGDIKFKQVKLTEDQSEHDIPFKLDTTAELGPTSQQNNQIFASIKPKSCHGICWTTILGAEVRNQNYEKPSTKKCEPIESVNVTTSIRKYLGYDYTDNKITINTNFSNNSTADEKDSYVEVTIIDLLDMTRRGQNFSIATGQTNFTFENLNSTNWYLAEYKYHRSVPFSFWDIERFAIEPNKTEENHGPVQLFFGYQIVGNKTKLGNGIKRFPKAKFVLNPEFKALNSVGIDSEPFCNSTDQHFWLTQDHPERELNSADLISAICTKNSHHPMCNHTTHKLKLSTCHTTKYCYRANLVLSDRVYQMKRHCVDIADQFTNVRHANSSEEVSNRHNSEENQEISKNSANLSFLYNVILALVMLVSAMSQ